MPDLKCKCGMEYHITDEYAKLYKDEGKRCPDVRCGHVMDVVQKKEVPDCYRCINTSCNWEAIS